MLMNAINQPCLKTIDKSWLSSNDTEMIKSNDSESQIEQCQWESLDMVWDINLIESFGLKRNEQLVNYWLTTG